VSHRVQQTWGDRHEDRTGARDVVMHDTLPRYVPVSTYRLQVHRDFPFRAAEEVASYLAGLGVGACYTSPYFTAEPGSTHGYDICNHNEINPELGGTAAHARFVMRLQELDLGHIVDFVPNHMGIGVGLNAWWREVLENGPSAPAARFFDIDWTPAKAELHAKLLLPILGDQYGKVLESGDLKLAFNDGVLLIKYYEHELPVNPRQAPRVYRRAVEPLTQALGTDNPQLHEFLSIISSLENMPAYTEQDAEQIAARQREKEVARARLTRLVTESPIIRDHIESVVREVNGQPGRPESFDALHELLESQAYRLAYWRTASHEINYRRFFDVNTLAGLRVEDPEVFASTHKLLGELIANGSIGGIRVDHPDGLFDPSKYFSMLQELAGRALGLAPDPSSSEPWRPIYIVAEKILSGHEPLPARWAVHGTSGYNFLNELNGLFVNSTQVRRMLRNYAKLTGRLDSFDDVLYDSKRLIMETAMASELNVLAHALDRIGESNRRSRDFTLDSLRDAIAEVIACFPVYRTYVDERSWTPEDRGVVVQAVGRARRRNPAMESSLFDFLLEVILTRAPSEGSNGSAGERREGYPPANADEARERVHFAMKLQQYTGPVQAKGLEDTAFYRYNLLLSLNEVGGDPERFGRRVDEFHRFCIERLRTWPYEMLATATHDTKLGEDTRARINAISEVPEDWARNVSRWMRINRAQRAMVDGEPAPDRNDEYRFYQLLTGVWPSRVETEGAQPDHDRDDIVERLKGAMTKSVKEAKLHTSWLTPNDAYENAVIRFVERVLSGAGGTRFLTQFLPFQQRVALLGAVNSLAQTALKIGAPGVPDFYQGTELWDFNLVDPDNRRPVDFAIRRDYLAELQPLLAVESDARVPRIVALLDEWRDGRIKLVLTLAGLQLRRELPDLFLSGDYVPLSAEITVNADVVAFARTRGEDAVIVVVPRLVAPLVYPDLFERSASARTSEPPQQGPPDPRGQRPVGDQRPRESAFPIGGAAWMTSRIILPDALGDRLYRHVVTGAEIRPVSSGAQHWVFVGQLFETLPVAILTSRI
jgi:(1->4)-alpha-D-glucan 1-alpha-D-glucosylmutase